MSAPITTPITCLDVLETQLFEIFDEVYKCIENGEKVRPHNTNVANMQQNAKAIHRKVCEALVSLGRIRGEYTPRS